MNNIIVIDIVGDIRAKKVEGTCRILGSGGDGFLPSQ
jgi:hypothetical protein